MKSATGLIKIGYTSGDGPAHRLLALQSLVRKEHRPINLVSALRMDRRAALDTERAAHRKLLPERVFCGPCGDEWFRVSGQRAGCVVRNAAEAIWNNRKLKTWADTAAPLKALGMTPRDAWRKFGART